jgi:hypothetical protein
MFVSDHLLAWMYKPEAMCDLHVMNIMCNNHTQEFWIVTSLLFISGGVYVC